MSTARGILKNTGASLLTQISTPVASFVLVFLIARFLGTSGLGEYSTAFSMYYIFQALSSLGLNLLITREVAQDNSKANEYFINGSFVAAFFSIFAAGIMCITINWITLAPEVIKSVYVLSLSLIFYTLALVSQSICKAYEKFEYITIPHIVGNIFKLSVGSFLLFRGYGLVSLMVVILANQIIIFILSLYFSCRFMKRPFGKINLTLCRYILRATPVFSLIIIVSTIRFNIDVLLLTKMIGLTDAGFYSAAYKLVNVFRLGISCYIMALQPIIFRVSKSSLEKFMSVCTESIRYSVIIILPIIAGITILGHRIIVLVFKQAFLPSAHALPILVWVLLFYSFNQILANALIGSNYQRANLQANIIGMVANISLNITLIPQLGFIGAAIATSGSALIVAAVQYYFVSKNLFKTTFFQLAKKPFASVALMTGVLLLLRNTNLVLIALISVPVYAVCLLGVKALSPKDMQVISDLWKGKRNLGVSQTEI